MSEKSLNLEHDYVKKLVVEKQYPTEVQDSVLWLADFTRDRCQSRISVLQEQIKRFRFEQTDNYYYKILSGRYFVAKDGTRIGSIHNFLEVVGKLQSAFVLSMKYGAVPFIETSVYRTIADYISVKSSPMTICKFGVIIGHTGSQKSASYSHICLTNNPKDENLRRRFVRVESSDSTSVGKFRTDLVTALGGSRKQDTRNKVNYLLERVQKDTTIIIDNAQRLYVEGAGKQACFEFLIKMQEDTGCTPILSLTPDSQLRQDFGKNAFFEQIIGRVGGTEEFLTLPEYAPRGDILTIADAFGLRDHAQHAKTLEDIAKKPGRIRILFNTLQKAKQLAEAQAEPLTIEHVIEAGRGRHSENAPAGGAQ